MNRLFLKRYLIIGMFIIPQFIYSSRLFGVLANDSFESGNEENINHIEARLNEFAEQGETHNTGWGLMYYQGGFFNENAGNIWRSPIPPLDSIPPGEDYPIWEDSYPELFTIENANLAMGHLRKATSGCGSEFGEESPPNPHPWIWQHGNTTYTFAHNGTLNNKEELRDLIGIDWIAQHGGLQTFPYAGCGGDWTSPEGFANVIDSELFFFWIMKNILEQDENVLLGIHSAVSNSEFQFLTYNENKNFLFSDGNAIWAFRSAKVPDFTDPNLAHTLYWKSMDTGSWHYKLVMSQTTSNYTAIDNHQLVYLPRYNEPVIIDSFEFMISIELKNLRSGLNLVGLPFAIDSLPCPNAIEESLYSYNSGVYVPEEVMTMGAGYWLRFEDVDTCLLFGMAVDELSIEIVEGWNLISGLTYPVEVNTIIDPEELIVPGTVYGFDGTYPNAETIEPGYGYWLRSFGDGEIIISSSASLVKPRFVNRLENANTITINDQTLYFGVSIPEEEKLSYSLPPKPPVGAFDVRFTGNWKYAEDFGEIEVMSSMEKLLISYNVKNDESWILESINGEEYVLEGIGEIKVYGNTERFTLMKRDEKNLPDLYALYQNYPNPFNPVTTISYQLPQPAFVNLSIFSLQGQHLRTLVDEIEDTGTRSVIWNAVDDQGIPVSTGIYLYRIRAGDFIQTRKLIVLK